MKILLLCLLSFTHQHVFDQSHMIKIDSNGRVASPLTAPKEYDRWKTNYDYGNQKIREAPIKNIYKKFEDEFDFQKGKTSSSSGISKGGAVGSGEAFPCPLLFFSIRQALMSVYHRPLYSLDSMLMETLMDSPS